MLAAEYKYASRDPWRAVPPPSCSCGTQQPLSTCFYSKRATQCTGTTIYRAFSQRHCIKMLAGRRSNSFRTVGGQVLQ